MRTWLNDQVDLVRTWSEELCPGLTWSVCVTGTALNSVSGVARQ